MGRVLLRWIKAITLPAACGLVVAFFAWHTINGDRGLEAQERRAAEIITARAELTRSEAERDALERRVQGLRGDRIDADQLDERARSLLNFVGRDEIIVPLGLPRRPGG
ncbi:FtsB family cell division protein [Humitalea sp. 24SJ18S-53]|uniref:FtsB family cell division protein n=1 Tax=Humitalea sp. 24SJ18S-53 TaxID=3422307 RepID=UPI003D6708BC